MAHPSQAGVAVQRGAGTPCSRPAFQLGTSPKLPSQLPSSWMRRNQPFYGAMCAAFQPESEAARLATAVTILAGDALLSPGSIAEQGSGTDGLDSAFSDRSVLDELRVLDVDSLCLAVGILRAHSPPGDASAHHADVALSERLLDVLTLLRARPGRTPTGSPTRSAAASSGADDFFAGPDEWADVRAALLSIGIQASTDEEDEEAAAWEVDGPGLGGSPIRRTRLLRSLPRLDAATAAELAAFLAEAAQRPAPNQQKQEQRQQAGSVPGEMDLEEEDEEAAWWAAVSQAYCRLWQQARVQQAAHAAVDAAEQH
jgi:hypothetical protein